VDQARSSLRVPGSVDGKPLLNVEAPVVRASIDEEIARWEAVRAAADADEEDKGGYLAFLVPVKDPKNGRVANELRPVRT
jgi:hypothetical protein